MILLKCSKRTTQIQVNKPNNPDKQNLSIKIIHENSIKIIIEVDII